MADKKRWSYTMYFANDQGFLTGTAECTIGPITEAEFRKELTKEMGRLKPSVTKIHTKGFFKLEKRES